MKTTDGGYTWKPVSDKYFGGTIGAIAVYPTNPDIVYVGTGEYTLRGNASHGDGVFKSTDGGHEMGHDGCRGTLPGRVRAALLLWRNSTSAQTS